MSRRRNKKSSVWPKIIIFVVILVLAAVIFGRKGEDKEKETVWQEGSMLRIGDTQVDYREGLVYLDAVKADYEQYYGSDIWKYEIDVNGNTMGQVIKDQTLEQIIYIKVVCQKADELGIVLSEEELQQVDQQTAAYMQKIQGSELLLHGVNADIVRRIYSDNLLARKTFEVTTLNVDTDIPDEEAAQRRFYTIAIRNYKIDASGNRAAYEGTELDKKARRNYYADIITLSAATPVKFVAVDNGKVSLLKTKGLFAVFQSASPIKNIVKLGMLMPVLRKVVAILVI